MNRRTFIKYLLVAPIALATLLISYPASSVVRKKEKPKELGINCKTCVHKGTDFYHGLCPQNDVEADKFPQEANQCFYYKELPQKSQWLDFTPFTEVQRQDYRKSRNLDQLKINRHKRHKEVLVYDSEGNWKFYGFS